MTRGYIYITLLSFFCSFSVLGQTVNEENDKETRLSSAQEMALILISKIDVPKIEYTPPKPPVYWTRGALTKLGFTQTGLVNWASGGAPTISLYAHADIHYNYKRGLIFWDNRARFSYGFIETFEPDPDDNDKIKGWYQKSDDNFEVDSKVGYVMFKKIYFSAILNFQTQLTQGFDNSKTNPRLLSNFMSPGYLTLGIGLDYKPFESLSINVSPLTGKLVMVTNPTLRVAYGNREDQAVKPEFGAQFQVDYNKKIKFLKLRTVLTLFSDYLNNPENINVRWDVDASFTITRFLSATLSTGLIYNDKILIKDKNGVEAPRVQFREALTLGFEFKFGNYQKPK